MHVAPTDESTVYSGKTPIDLTVHPARGTVRHPKRADSRGSRPVRSLCEHPPNTREQDDPHVGRFWETTETVGKQPKKIGANNTKVR